MANQWTYRGGRQGDPDVIDGAEFAKVFKRWVERWYQERPSRDNIQGFKDKSHAFYSPYDYVEDKTGINNRKLRGLVAGEFRVVSLHRHAIPILDAIGHPEYLYDGTLEVVRSPYWSMEHYAEFMRERGCF